MSKKPFIRTLGTLIAAAGIAALSGCATTAPSDKDIAVKITPEMASATVMHKGEKVTLMRNQDQSNEINPAFQMTSRKCPPFCIKPIKLHEGVETVAELEMIDALERIAAGDTTVMVVDNRTPDWHARGSIPGSVNIPFTKISRAKGADDLSIAESLEKFGAKETANGWDFSNAKTLYLFCNGMWCGQSPAGIAGLLSEGYPAEKIKYYRGGMQDWEVLGLTTFKP
ncbi:MAG: rhodanese-like domain-containing protein [Gammaproteobacteria bacterium]|nr:rhodanese-like domain-containing protein [Gammaproteobacteria bacterium]MCW8841682.1 rhodanese-like domain-containing protein [Gammaproteobacteria bacterium]MCW8958515.1 rhodanese-like domain-containing protein [Gammaproteobacteria bacterium]MCW8973654.1 rhodanese-like domain-containing protein [Gammaproteobacteria bacterium]MCW8991682.1 rhodanese-like domain-containing protein [Gammaproteobacteria bacterium]